MNKMNILHKIRRNTVTSQALLLTLVFSLFLLLFASWSASNHGMQTSTQPYDAIEMSADFNMINCHHQTRNMDQQECGKDCCKNIGSNRNCKDCPNSCVPLVFFSLKSESFIQFINSTKFVQNLQSTISSRKIPPPFRPPIPLHS